MCLDQSQRLIDKVDSFVYLGVNIDNRLTFEKCINGTISRVHGRLVSFARIRKLLDRRTSELIYKQTKYYLYWVIIVFWLIQVRNIKYKNCSRYKIELSVLSKSVVNI